MHLAELRERLLQIEGRLPDNVWVELCAFERDGRITHVGLTDRFRARARKQRLWRSKRMLTALRNAKYGFDPQHARSRGGSDGVFLVDREYQPRNPMMRKMFDGFLDNADGAADALAAALGVAAAELLPVRVVSHDLRLLGVLKRTERADWLILVDIDCSKG